MTINDLRMDIITTVSQLTDVEALKKIQADINITRKPTDEMEVWKGADMELRSGVSFDELVREQQYRPVTFVEFTHDPLMEDWPVSLDELLAIANAGA